MFDSCRRSGSIATRDAVRLRLRRDPLPEVDQLLERFVLVEASGTRRAPPLPNTTIVVPSFSRRVNAVRT